MSDEVEDSVAEPVAEEAQVDSAPVDAGDAEPVQAEPQQQEVWSHFRSMPEFEGQDDNSIAQRLYEAMQREEHAARALQQYQSIVPVTQEYIQNKSEFERWKSAQAAAMQNPQPQQPQPEEKPWWNPPEVKDSYKRYLTRDENGREVIDPNAPMDARIALEDYQQYRADFAQKFLDNPQETLGPMVERVAMERAEELIDQRMQRMNDENYVAQLETDNRDWLYDQNGNVSAEGLSAQKYIQDAKSIGINGAQARWDYATRMVERDLLLAALQQQTQQPRAPQQPMPQQPQQQRPEPTTEQKNMEYLRNQAMRTATQRAAASTNTRAPTRSMTFEERLTAAAQENGLL